MNLLLLITLLVYLTSFSTMKTNAQSNSLQAATLDWKVTQSGQLKYLVYLPPDYATQTDTRWPVLLFLHGAGERGSDLDNVAVHGPLSHVRQGTNFPFIIVAPQCPAGELWENEPLLELLRAIEKTYAVDENRIYLTGLSMGGYGAWKLGLAHPDRFAALAPVCGGANMIEVILKSWDDTHRKRMLRLPVWAFHGAKDDVVPPIESQRVVNSLKKMGHKKIAYTVYPKAKHDSWKLTYADPKFYEWLLSQKR